MKRILFLTKTLLAAALLCVGQNAWGDDVYTPVYTRATVSAWTADDLTDWNGSSSYLSLSATNGIGATSNLTASSTKTFSGFKSNSKIKYVIEWYYGGSPGRDINYDYIQIGDKIRLGMNNSYYARLSTNAGSSYAATNYGSNAKNGVTATITIIFDTSTRTVESFTFGATDLTSLVSSLSLSTFNTVTLGFTRGGSTNYDQINYIKTITVSECEQTVTNVGYTINYKLGENIVRSVTSEGVVGQEITADVAVDGTETGYENHYLITAGSAPSMTLVAEAASNVLDVPVRAPYTATLKVTTTVGTNEPVLVETPLTETDSKVHTWSYAYPMYVLDGGKYYIADNTATFGEGGEFTNGQVIEKSVTYSTVDESVVFFRDAEAEAGTNYLYSNGGSGYVATQNARDRGISVGTLDAGVYSFIVNITAANRRSLVIRQSTNDPLVSVGTSNEDMTTGVKSANFTLNEETSSLYINGANSGEVKTNQSEDFDYVLIKKLPSTVSKNITAAGYATYCSPYALDFSEVSGLTAYIVTGTVDETTTLALASVSSVPANTGVLLEGAAGDYDIPVIASSATDVSGNKLVGVTENTNIDANTGYVLMGSPKVGFYQNNNEFTVGANTAYLPANFAEVAAGARSAYFFGGDITGVEAVEAATEAKAQEGKFIENGKLVIVKNGVKYNAAGQQVK